MLDDNAFKAVTHKGLQTLTQHELAVMESNESNQGSRFS